MQVFGKCGQCLEKPPYQLVEGEIKPEESTVETYPQVDYGSQVEYESQEDYIPLFREDYYDDYQPQREQVIQNTQSYLTSSSAERLRKFKIVFKENLLKFKEKLLKFKEKVKISLENRRRSKIILQENIKSEQRIEKKAKIQQEIEEKEEEMIDLELLSRESYLEELPKIDIQELNREIYLEGLPKINIDDLNREIALEKAYEKETGKHAIWRGKKTKGYLKWKAELPDNKSLN